MDTSNNRHITENIENTKNKQTKPKKNKKNRCNVKGCKGRIVLMVGHCKWCDLDFCQEHRIPECHNCHNLTKCKEESFKKNEALNSINCQFKKIDTIKNY